MRLIANKPCSFGGRQFYIGDEIPGDFVADAKVQEKMGVIAIVNNAEGVSDRESDTFFTQEQVEKMVTEAVDEAVNNMIQEIDQKPQEAADVLQENDFLPKGTMIIPIKGDGIGDNKQQMELLITPEEIQQVFHIMQMNATDGAEAIAEVNSENVLILLHAADTRKTIKDAAKKQADNRFSTSGNPNESIDTNMEGVDT